MSVVIVGHNNQFCYLLTNKILNGLKMGTKESLGGMKLSEKVS